jgi:hypothetical protein
VVSSGTRAAQNNRSRPRLPGACGVGLLLGALAAACVRAPLAGECIEVEPGDLVISELRGTQMGSYRQWIELYNASDRPLALLNLRLEFTKIDGSGPLSIVIRDGHLEIEPGEYVVVGGGDPDSFPYIDYDYTPDYQSATSDNPRDLYGAAALELWACDVRLDRVVYKLPAEGTLALDGAAAPDAASNDDSQTGWCFDIDPGAGPQTGIGLNGSPGEANPPCP